jgi:L-rhamnose isomerase
MGLLQPRAKLIEAETAGDLASRLALQEDAKSLPWGAVWAEFCERNNVALDGAWFPTVKTYEREVLSRRV